MIVKNLLHKSDQELIAMLVEIDNEPVEHTPTIISELTRRTVVRLLETSQRLKSSSDKLEKLTICLIVLTVVLALVALPPALVEGKKLLSGQ